MLEDDLSGCRLFESWFEFRREILNDVLRHLEEGLGGGTVVGHDDCRGVGIEVGIPEDATCDEGGDALLASFENDGSHSSGFRSLLLQFLDDELLGVIEDEGFESLSCILGYDFHLRFAECLESGEEIGVGSQFGTLDGFLHQFLTAGRGALLELACGLGLGDWHVVSFRKIKKIKVKNEEFEIVPQKLKFAICEFCEFSGNSGRILREDLEGGS